jgi:hypothetical protein
MERSISVLSNMVIDMTKELNFQILYIVHPWYPQVYNSKDTNTEGKPQMHRMHRVQCYTADA